MNIIGLYGAFDWSATTNFSPHDSGVTLFIDGKHICSIVEERLTRIKYEGNYPKKSIEYCLSEGKLKNKDIDLVCIPSMCFTIFYEQLHSNLIFKMVKESFPNAKIKIISHHLCHAASAIFTSKFDKGSFITSDSAGSLILKPVGNSYEDYSWETNSIGYFDKSQKKINIFYGLPHFNDFANYYSQMSYKIYKIKMKHTKEMHDPKLAEESCGKIMGLSAYGKKDRFEKHYQIMQHDLEERPLIYFDIESLLNNDYDDADAGAFEIQKNFESALIDYIRLLKEKKYIDDNVCFAGGSFLNVLGNSAIKYSGIINNTHVCPFPGDSGLSFGSAAWASFMYDDNDICMPKNMALLGKNYTDDEIEYELIQSKIKYHKFDFDELCMITAEHLNENKIIGWFQNRSEFGPRALGARSILMNPKPKENKDILNSRVKHREYWRPFAGIILEDYLKEYFNDCFTTPYMLYSLVVKDEKVNEIAAITHEDKTCRIQTVNHEYNPQVSKLIEKFYKITGTPVVLNTSFNDNGEPIVETPKDAIQSFLKMNIDFLVIGNFIVVKEENK